MDRIPGSKKEWRLPAKNTKMRAALSMMMRPQGATLTELVNANIAKDDRECSRMVAQLDNVYGVDIDMFPNDDKSRVTPTGIRSRHYRRVLGFYRKSRYRPFDSRNITAFG